MPAEVPFLKPRAESGQPSRPCGSVCPGRAPPALPGSEGRPPLPGLFPVPGRRHGTSESGPLLPQPRSPRERSRTRGHLQFYIQRFRFPSSPLKGKEEETAEINFNNGFYLDPNVPKVRQHVITVNETVYSVICRPGGLKSTSRSCAGAWELELSGGVCTCPGSAGGGGA